ncbi:MAG: glycosyltransferase [bacterium]|nr:glycosyltransferase [bacterium]
MKRRIGTEQRTVPIVMICDNAYIVPTCTAIQSIIMNKKEETKMDIFILTDGLNEESTAYLNEFVSDDVTINIRTGKMDNLKNIHTWRKKGDYCAATETALLKFEIANIIPEYDRIIYLDGDIICRKDLNGLFITKMTDQYAAVVMDSGKLYSQRELVKNNPKYFNSGVMLLNLKKMRDENLSEVLIETKRNLTDNTLMDQNVLNIVFNQKIKLLPIKYNLLYVNLMRAHRNNWFKMEALNKMFHSEYEDLTAVRKDAVILHFSSKDKPWKFYDTNCAEEWYGYFLKSPVGHLQLERKSIEKQQLKERVNNQARQIRDLKEALKRSEEERQQLAYSNSEIWKSFSFKAGRAITIMPRGVRKGISQISTNIQAHKDRIPPVDGLTEEKREREIIVSLTTYNKRIEKVDLVITSLLRQTVKPDRIQLYLDEAEFTQKDLNKHLRTLQKRGVEIYFCRDLKPHKKYYYAMKNHPDAIVITVDDDIIYENDLIEKLYESYMQYPDCVSAMRVHSMKFNADGTIKPYTEWKHRDKSKILEPDMALFPTGCGGVLYPPHTLDEQVYNIEELEELCLCGDDIWLKAMAVRKGTKTVLAAWQNPLAYIEDTQDIGLHNQNVGQNKNDEMIEKVFNRYPEVHQTILKNVQR